MSLVEIAKTYPFKEWIVRHLDPISYVMLQRTCTTLWRRLTARYDLSERVPSECSCIMEVDPNKRTLTYTSRRLYSDERYMVNVEYWLNTTLNNFVVLESDDDANVKHLKWIYFAFSGLHPPDAALFKEVVPRAKIVIQSDRTLRLKHIEQ